MNSNQNPNPSQILTPQDIASLCRQHRVYPPGDPNPTLEDAILAFHQKLQEHQKSQAATASETSADFYEWTQTHQALQSALNQLRQLHAETLRASVTPTKSKIINNHFGSRSEHPSRGSDLKGLGSPSSIINNSEPAATPNPIPSNPTPPSLSSEASAKEDPASSHLQNPQNSPAIPPFIASTHPNLPKNFTTNAPSLHPQTLTRSYPFQINPTAPQKSADPQSHPNSASEPPNLKSSIINHQSSIPPQIPGNPQSAFRNPHSAIPSLALAKLLHSTLTKSKGKPRPDDKIAHLTDDDRDQLFHWLQHNSYDNTVELVAQPRPEGLDLHTSRSALQRFYEKHDLQHRLQTTIDLLQAASSSVNSVPSVVNSPLSTPAAPSSPITDPHSSPPSASADVNSGELNRGGLGKPIINPQSTNSTPEPSQSDQSAEPSPSPQSAIRNPHSAIDTVLELLVQSQALRIASRPNLEGPTLHHFLRHIQRTHDQQLRQQAIDLRQKSLAFKMQTATYDLTKETLKKLPELNELAANQKLTPAQLFSKAYVKIVGQETADTIHEANRNYRERYSNQTDQPQYDEPQPDLEFFKPELSQTETFNLMLQNPHTPVEILKAQQAIQ